MTTKKVPLVHYVDGERQVIGEAVVSTDGSYLDITATVTSPAYRSLFPTENLSYLSLGNSEAAIIPKEPDVKQKARKKKDRASEVPYPKRGKQGRGS